MATKERAPEADYDTTVEQVRAALVSLGALSEPERSSVLSTLDKGVLDPLLAAGRRPKVRLTADLPADVSDLLTVTAERSGYNKITTLVRAIRVFAELQETIDNGGEILLKDKDGTRSRLILR